MQLRLRSRAMSRSHQRWNLSTVVNPKFPHQGNTLLTNSLIQNDRAVRIRNRPVEGAGGNAKNVASTLQPNDMERLFPGQVHQEEGSAATGREQIVFLIGMQIELPGSALRIVGGDTAGPL